MKARLLHEKLFSPGSIIVTTKVLGPAICAVVDSASSSGTRTYLRIVAGKVADRVEFKMVANVPVAVDDDLVIWAQGSRNGATLYSLKPSTGKSLTISLPFRAATGVTIADGKAYFIVKDQNVMELYRTDLASGTSDRIDNLAAFPAFFRFGQSSNEKLVILDPVSGSFRVDRVNDGHIAGVWYTLDSKLVEEAKRKSPPRTVSPGIMGYESVILNHAQNSPDRHLFILSRGEPGQGNYALEVDATGRSQRALFLQFPNESPKHVPFHGNLFSLQQGLGFLTPEGQLMAYTGVRQ